MENPCVNEMPRTKDCVLSCVQLFETPWTVALPGSSVHGIFQVRILKWLPLPSSGDLPDPGNPCLSCLLHQQADCFTTVPPRLCLYICQLGSFVTATMGACVDWGSQKVEVKWDPELTIGAWLARRDLQICRILQK